MLVRMATLGGAEDLGLADKTGSLPPGKRADLILVRTGAPHLGATGDPYDALVQLAQPSDIDTVVADGRILRRKGEFTALDYGKLLADATQSVETLKAKAKWT
jgi:5-methylthioadenosine/S-adenosylhomocysteine deaminase